MHAIAFVVNGVWTLFTPHMVKLGRLLQLRVFYRRTLGRRPDSAFLGPDVHTHSVVAFIMGFTTSLILVPQGATKVTVLSLGRVLQASLTSTSA